MIEIEDLRIGNKILFDSEIDSVVSIYSRGVDGGFKSRWSSDRLHGIELTDDILKSLGFKIFDSETWFPYWEINHTRPNKLVGFSFKISTIGGKEWRWLEGNANVPFYYVHELQNLYYSLTGSEFKTVW